MAPQKTPEMPVTSVADWALKMLRKHAADGKIAQIFAEDGTSRTYAELLRDSVYVAAGLSSMGLQSGDMVLTISRNSHDIFPLAFGCIMADVIIGASVADLTAGDARSNITLVKPKVVLTRKHNLSVIKEAIEGAGTELSPKPELYDIDAFFKEIVSKGSNTDVEAFTPVKIADPKTHGFLCLFSSGTTGPQKGILINDCQFLLCVLYGSSLARKYEGPLFATNQIFWGTWWFTILRALECGRTRIFVDKINPLDVADIIHKFKPSVWYGSTTGIAPIQRALRENPGKWDFSSLNAIFLAGNILEPSVHRSLVETFKTIIVSEYGSTEMGIQFVSDLDAPILYGSVGKPVCSVKLVDVETRNKITEPFQLGELVTETASLVCYINNPEDTKEAFDEQGWFKTGDVLYFDNDDNYFAMDRIKEMFKYRDVQVAPSEVEALISKIPGVAEVVVVGKKADMSIGVLPAAFIVKEKGSNLTEQDVHDFIEKADVHDSKKLRGGVFFIDETPKNANGKVLRRKLQDIVNGNDAA